MIYVAGAGGVSIFDRELHQVGFETAPEMLYITPDPTGRFLYGVAGIATGRAHVWRIDGTALIAVSDPVPTGGGEPCHLAVDPTGRQLVVANYGSAGAGSVAVLPIAGDGTPGVATTLTGATQPGPDPDRQGESHIHQVVFGPSTAAGQEVLVVDLGADQVVSYLLVDGVLTEPVTSYAPTGSGPRHLVLRSGAVAVSGELTSTLLRARHVDRRLTEWRVDASTGRALPPGQVNYPSDLLAGPDGDSLFLANRGVDTVTVLSASTGEILSETSCSAWPRQMAIGNGRLFVAATHADRVDVLDTRTMQMDRTLDVAGPMCVVLTAEDLEPVSPSR